MMDRIISSTERHKLYHSLIAAGSEIEEDSPPHAVAAAAAGLAESIGAVAIVGFTSSGTTVARISRKRPALPILAITPELQVARRMALMWGAHSVHSEDIHSYEEMVNIAEATVRTEGFGRSGELAVVVAGIPFGQSGSTNNLRVIRIGS
jgi:pyruvate kinase